MSVSSNGLKWPTKDPEETLDYQLDWTAWLAETGDTITSSAASADGVTLVSTSNTATAVTVWLSGGTAGGTGSVSVSITTAAGRVAERTVRISVRQL